jgi:WG containing repeat
MRFRLWHLKWSVAPCVFLLAVLLSGVSPAWSQSEPLVIVQNGKFGFIDHDGRVIIAPQFIWALNFWHGFGTVYVCGHYASIDSSGTLFPRRIAIEGHLEPWKQGDKFGFVDGTGRFKIEPAFDDALPFSEGFAAVKIDNQWGFINSTGTQVIPPKFDDAFYFREGVASAWADSGEVLIGTSGKTIASGYTPIEQISEGRISAFRGRRAGYLDLQGNVAIPFIYEEVRAFHGGLAAVEKNGKWGYLDRDGKIAIPFRFDDAGAFGSGLAPARIGNRTGFIDRTGEFAFDLPFDTALGFETEESEFGLPTADSDVSPFWTSDNKFGYVNTSGLVIWGPAIEIPSVERIGDWSNEEKARSCESIPDDVKAKIAGFPPRWAY